MYNLFLILFYWFLFSNCFKIVDLIDEHGWIWGRKWFVIKYISAFLTILSIFFVVKFDNHFTIHFVSIFLFWILKNKMEYPSHVLIMFVGWIILGYFFEYTLENIIITFLILIGYMFSDYFIKSYKSINFIAFFFYKHLWRFYLMALFLSFYLWDYNIILHTMVWLLSMEIVRFLIRKRIIKIEWKQT